ncbi:adenosylcobalamin-dependent ribonucleoside-diphosphate reductase [Marinicrinis lubricantis]|uniref:Vitamin B12-dependent ribonucleotide reductase n=1 Tax=Marinicrinis lubricantis TaxID=2086470 RepID=A0ABW1INV4_9BACL
MKTMQSNRLEGLSEKIFLDRYAMKDADTNNTKVGDYVLVLTKDDPKFPAKEVGEVIERNGKNVKVKLRSGDVIDSDIHKLTLTVEKTPDELWDRLAKAMASVEAPEKQQEWQEKFRYILDDWKLVPGGRIAAGAGASDELTLFNCYVIPSPHDSRGGIMETLSEMTEIMSRGGGVGINLSSLRPRRAIVRGVNGTSSGAVSWGGLFSYTTGLIEQGGSRRGALMLMINDWHPDLMRFITVKQTAGEITNANLSVCVSNDFMKAVKEDLDWDLVFPDTSDPDYNDQWNGDLKAWKELGKDVIHYDTVRARDVWHTIIESAWKSAEPGVVFMEYYNDMSNSWYFNPIICTNPCGEQGLPAWGVCNLSAINLSKFYDEENHDVNWDELAKTVRYSVRFLDNVIDKTPYHFEENQKNQQAERRVGLGSMGLAELLIRLNIRYGSPESLEFLDKLYGFMAREAYLSSSEIAAEKGSFKQFDAEKFLQSGFMKNMVSEFPEVGESVRENGMRNVTVITQAPTGSTGTMVGTSTGIEPYFAFEFYRQSRLGFDKQLVPIAQEWKDAHPDAELPDYFVTAMDLKAEDHIRVQAAIQRWVDSSISKTANCPSDFTVEETKALYELAFDLGCKGVTIYRDGSRDTQVLHTKGKDEDKTDNKGEAVKAEAAATKEDSAKMEKISTALKVDIDKKTENIFDKQYKRRPQVLSGATYKFNTPFGMAYITINDLDGHPSEIFLNVGKAGSDVFAMSEALGRVCSLFLRYGEHGQKERLLIKHLKGIGGSGGIGFGPNRVESIADAVAKSLELHMDHIEEQGAYATSNDSSSYTAPVAETAAIEAQPHQHDSHESYGVSSTDLCPSCGSASLVNTEGCKTCTSCGYSKCS